ncbi:MAG: hypothetical protein WKF92_13880 [Pyrinomonadaceae bacterium]
MTNATTFVINENEFSTLAKSDDFACFLNIGRLLNAMTFAEMTAEHRLADPKGNSVQQFRRVLIVRSGLLKIGLKFIGQMSEKYSEERFFDTFADIILKQVDGNAAGRAKFEQPETTFALISYDEAMRATIRQMDIRGHEFLELRPLAQPLPPCLPLQDSPENREVYQAFNEIVEDLTNAWQLGATQFLSGIAPKLGIETLSETHVKMSVE